MKGMVFTEFVELVEDKFSPDLADQIIDECDLPSGGAYTSVGAYDHQEIIELVSRLSAVTSVPVRDLIITFGKHLMGKFSQQFPELFNSSDLFDFLEGVHGHIHVEVKKLYPDAELPDIATERRDNTLILKYNSNRPFADLAFGLISGAIDYFGEQIILTRSSDAEELNTEETFTLQRVIN